LLIDLPKLFIELSLMTALPRKRYLSVEQRRALQLLADIPFGVRPRVYSVMEMRLAFHRNLSALAPVLQTAK
jgi:hypothetical protein